MSVLYCYHQLPRGYGHSWDVQGLMQMRANVGVGPLLAGAALREHHRILDDALQLEDWSRAEALFLQVLRPSNTNILAKQDFACRPFEVRPRDGEAKASA